MGLHITGGLAIQTVTLSVHRFDTAAARLWAVGQMALARRDMARLPGCSFWKLCGSGGENFAAPDPSIWAILAAWPDATTAERQVEDGAPFHRWRRRADETWTVFLAPTSVRGHWSGHTPFAAGSAEVAGPIAALTRATIRPSKLLRFWRRAPEISTMIAANPDVLFRIGLGEIPVLHQVTFSIWPDTDSMARFARAGGPHARAIRAVREGGWFAEELYARFAVTGERGSWNGTPPLARPRREAA